MKKKILVAVGDCVYSKDAIKYTSKIFSSATDVFFTFLNIRPTVPGIIAESAVGNPGIRSHVEFLLAKENEAAECIVGELKDLAVSQGISSDRIDSISEPMQAGVARDILEKGEKGGYDAIVLARRGLTPSRDFFIGTTAAKVVEHGLHIPVWVVDGKASPLDILIAIDGGPDSIHLLIYVLNMVGSNPGLHLTLFHVLPSLKHYYTMDFQRANPNLEEMIQRTDRKRMEVFQDQALDVLKRQGILDTQVRRIINESTGDVSTAVLREAKSGGYGTVVIGRRGEREAFFTGRIATRLIQKISEQTLWVVS